MELRRTNAVEGDGKFEGLIGVAKHGEKYGTFSTGNVICR
jgi:hypothetical protein